MIGEDISDITLLMTYDETSDKVTIIHTNLVSIFLAILGANSNIKYEKNGNSIVLTLMNFHAIFKQFISAGFINDSSLWESARTGNQEIPDITCNANI